MNLPRRWISIDPGFNTGVAVWDKKGELVYTQLIREVKTDELPLRILSMTMQLEKICDTYDPNLVLIEGVYLFGEATRSKAAARRGDLFKLAYIVGAYIQVASNYTTYIQVLNANQWKGQLPDQVIKKRVLKFTGLCFGNQHVPDAIGIGMNHMGKL